MGHAAAAISTICWPFVMVKAVVVVVPVITATLPVAVVRSTVVAEAISAFTKLVSPVPPLATTKVPDVVIVPDEVIGPPL